MKINKLLFAILLPLFYSCTDKSSNTSDSNPLSVTDSAKYATGFTISSGDSATIVNVLNPWQGAKNVNYEYTLIPRCNFSATDKNLSHIPIPVQRVICMSTTYVAFLGSIEAQNTICGISGTNYVFDSTVRKSIDSGLIQEVGYEQTLNYELIASLKPDVLLCYGIGEESMATFEKLHQMGIRTMVIGDYLENHPLGKTEWIKVFGALTGNVSTADSIFNVVMNSYNETAAKASLATSKPKVFLNLPYKDVWYAPGVDNYFVNFIRDAGGEYLFSNLTGSKSYPISFENAYQSGLQADVWLNQGSANSLDEIIHFDSRLAQLKPYKNGSVFNNTNRTTESGGSDFWESGTLNPHIILMDMISILHNDILPEHKLVYFKKLK